MGLAVPGEVLTGQLHYSKDILMDEFVPRLIFYTEYIFFLLFCFVFWPFWCIPAHIMFHQMNL